MLRRQRPGGANSAFPALLLGRAKYGLKLAVLVAVERYDDDQLLAGMYRRLNFGMELRPTANRRTVNGKDVCSGIMSGHPLMHPAVAASGLQQTPVPAESLMPSLRDNTLRNHF